MTNKGISCRLLIVGLLTLFTWMTSVFGNSRKTIILKMDQKPTGIVLEVKQRSSKLTDPLPKAHLIEMLIGQISTRVEKLLGSNPLATQSNVEGAVIQSTLQDNLTRIKAKIKTISTELLKSFTKASKPNPSVVDPRHTFQSIQNFRILLEADINAAIDQMIPAESETRRLLNLEEIFLSCESELLSHYEKMKDKGLLLLENEFNSQFQPRIRWTEEFANCGFFRVDAKLMDCYQVSKTEMNEIFRLSTGSMLPKTLEIRYGRRMRDWFVDYGNELIQGKYIPEIIERMNVILEYVSTGRDGLVVFDDRRTNAAVRELVLAAVYQSIVKEGFPPEIVSLEERFAYLGTELMRFGHEEAFYRGLFDFQSQATFDQQCFIVLSVLLLLSGASFQQDMLQCDYSASTRRLFRTIVSLFFAPLTSGELLKVDPWILGRSAELALATFLSQKNHPLVSGLPAKIFEEIAQYGGQREFDKAMTRQEAPALSYTQRLADRVINTVLSISSEPSKLTFAWKCLNHTPSINTTLVISGFLSEKSNFELDWIDTAQWPMQGTVLALQWDAETRVKYIGKSILEGLLAIPHGFRAVANTAVSGPIELFKTARKKAKMTAKMLADEIRAQAFGQGSITLIAFSLGCYVVHCCLKYLAKDPPVSSPILDVVLLGGAVSSDPKRWRIGKQVVQGRLVNVFSRRDKVLQYMYQLAMAGKNPPIGLGPIDCERVENYDASDFIKKHMDHRKMLKNDLCLCDYKA